MHRDIVARKDDGAVDWRSRARSSDEESREETVHCHSHDLLVLYATLLETFYDGVEVWLRA